MRSRRSGTGFSLLEAVVALAILVAAGLALFAAMTQSLQMLGRVERARELDALTRNALAIVEQINPMQHPAGESALGELTVRWRSELVEPVRDGATGFLQPGYFEVGLYRVQVELWRRGALEHAFDVRRAGYRQVRSPPSV